MSPPIISIIVPVYNSAFYLEAAIDSLQKQTCEKIEILLIDDGSTDGSSAICRAAAKDNSSIRIFHLYGNHAVSAAPGVVLRAARG